MACLGGVQCAVAGVVFADGTFNLADYDVSVYQTGGAAIAVQQTMTGGNPDAALQVLTRAPTDGAPLRSREYLINPTFLYDPRTSGAISGISFSTDNYGMLSDGSRANWEAQLLILQDSELYIYQASLPAVFGSWVTGGGSNLQAADFNLLTDLTGRGVDTSRHPDFAGGSLLFGISVGYAPGVANGLTWDRRVDNLRIDVSAVPEPGTLLLVVTGMLVLLRRSRTSRL
jgi:hypothetical protein